MSLQLHFSRWRRKFSLLGNAKEVCRHAGKKGMAKARHRAFSRNMLNLARRELEQLGNEYTRRLFRRSILKTRELFSRQGRQRAEIARKKFVASSNPSAVERSTRDMGFQSPCVKREMSGFVDWLDSDALSMGSGSPCHDLASLPLALSSPLASWRDSVDTKAPNDLRAPTCKAL